MSSSVRKEPSERYDTTKADIVARALDERREFLHKEPGRS
jgi:hypothetical protein